MRRPVSICLLFSAVLLASSCAPSPEDARPVQAVRADARDLLLNLFGAVVDDSAGNALEVGVIGRDDPAWPLITYLRAERLLQQRDPGAARGVFAELAIWAVEEHPAGPYGDTWGGSGLAVFGLWRWLQLLEQQPDELLDRDEFDEALTIANRLRETRFFAGMVGPDLLPASPALEEQLADLLAHLAWRSDHPEAASLFIDFLSVASTTELDAMDRTIYASLLAQGLAAEERLILFRARRMLGLASPRAEKTRAADMLRNLWDSSGTPPDVRLAAGYEWAYYERQRADREELIAVLTQVIDETEDSLLAERALFARGIVQNRGLDPNTEAFRRDMRGLVETYPASRLVDDALNQLASDAFYAGETESALDYYRRLQELQTPHDFQDSAYYLPALILVGRGGAADLSEADRNLREYVGRYPDGVFRLRSLFWRGRIAEQLGQLDQASALFQRVIEEGPFDYYGVRARLHRELGPEAVTVNIPAPGSRVRMELRAEYQQSRPAREIVGDSPYHERLRAIVATGLYSRMLLAAQRNDTRIDSLSLDELEVAGRLPATALLLATRQDALAARDVDGSASNWLQLAGFLGQEAQDWPLALAMTEPRGTSANDRLTALQSDPRYLASVYPNVDSLTPILVPLKTNAWEIGGSRALSQALMYSVMRQESSFYPRAISAVGALGLFQFMPATFNGLGGQRRLQSAGLNSSADYLFNPELNIALWAEWVQSEHRLTDRDAIADMMMRHQAGSGNVRRWLAFWEELGIENDLEYQIETARFRETRNFVRWTLRDLAIVDASGMFENE